MSKGYLIVRVRIDDPEQYKKYMAVSPDAIAAFGGAFIVRGGRNETLEGEPETYRVVVAEFPSYEAAKNCYQSDLYQAAKKLREGAGDAQFVLVEGV
ncbi:DUF1330 domain-containing protein [Pikeienuella sp. HZG-20]|uniref:DUF1330 domain-containing protein n=1 Tax=Paludibacillus litoralis TaxID=3133267 RepID=UPI0030ED8DAD